MESSELYHHGIKGMKWGIRRTKAQLGHDTTKKKRSLKESYTEYRKKRSEKKNAKLQKKNEAIEAERKKAVEQKKADVLKSRSAKTLYENANLFSDQELQSAYNRLALERNINSLIPQEKTAGQKFAEKSATFSQSMGNLSKAAASMYSMYGTVSKLMGGTSASTNASAKAKPGSNAKVVKEVIDETKKTVNEVVDDKLKDDFKRSVAEVLYETPSGYDSGFDERYRKRLPSGK